MPLGDGTNLYVLYPLIPWIGVMAAGYLLGPVMQREADARQRVLLMLGAAITLGFIVLRATNLYGDPAPWTVQETWPSTLLSFLNCEKYPPSLLYLMMTLGPALMLLASFEHAAGRFRTLAYHLWKGSVLLLCRPHLFDPWARRRHGPRHDRHPHEHPRDRPSSPGRLFRLASGARSPLSDLPLVRAS